MKCRKIELEWLKSICNLSVGYVWNFFDIFEIYMYYLV